MDAAACQVLAPRIAGQNDRVNFLLRDGAALLFCGPLSKKKAVVVNSAIAQAGGICVQFHIGTLVPCLLMKEGTTILIGKEGSPPFNVQATVPINGQGAIEFGAGFSTI